MSTFKMSSIVWSEPHLTTTKGGARRQVRTWFIPRQSSFWSLWNNTKSTLKQRGYSVTKWQDRWMLNEWRLVGQGAQSRSREQAVQAAQTLAQLNGAGANIDPPLPAMMAERFKEVEGIYRKFEGETGEDYSFQFPSIKRLALAVEANGGALDASDTGIGKTAVACAVARVCGRKLLVVCPKSVIPPWEAFVQRFGVDARIINYEMLRTGRTDLGEWQRKRFVFNSRMFDPDDWLFVFDECHRLKDYRTQNCAMGIASLQLHYRTIGLSATAADNPLHMKFTALLTGLIEHPAHWRGWLMSNGVRKGKWGMEFVGGHEVLQRLHRQIFPARGSRIRIAELGKRFPETQIAAEAYDMGKETTKQINRIYQLMRREIDKLERAKATDWQSNVLTAMLRARQETELLKVPTIVSMARDGLEEGSSVIVALNYHDSVMACARQLQTKYNVETITGQDKGDERQQAIEEFNDDDLHVVVMNIKAGGLGISLHGTRDGRPRLVLISPTPSAIDLRQTLGRAHRAGGAVSIQRVVFAAHTIEEEMCRKVRPKLRRIDLLNDGDLQYATDLERVNKPKTTKGT